MDLIKKMFDGLAAFPVATKIKYLHKQYQDNEKFVFILGECKYSLEKNGVNCMIKMNQQVQHISFDVYNQAIQIFQTNTSFES